MSKLGNFDGVDRIEAHSKDKVDATPNATEKDRRKLDHIGRCKANESNPSDLKDGLDSRQAKAPAEKSRLNQRGCDMSPGKDGTTIQAKAVNDNPKHGDRTETLHQPKRELKNHFSPNEKGFKMNTPATIEHVRSQFDEEGKKYFDSHIAAGGGIDGQRAKLRGSGREYWLTRSSDGRASGRFATDEHPGATAQERKENLQIQPGNDCGKVEKIRADRPSVVLESRVAPQTEWAKEAGYNAREGVKQIYTPSLNPNGPIESGKYTVLFDKQGNKK